MPPVADAPAYETLLAEVQRLRGRVYLEDGAIQRSQLTPDGRFLMENDRRAWHLLSVGETGVLGCIRVLVHGTRVRYPDMAVRHSALARSPETASKLEAAVEAEVADARLRGVSIAETGAWALDKSVRCATEGLRLALGSYSLTQLLGNVICISTATFRHGSAAILQKIGGRLLAHKGDPLPIYFDPQYNCEMAILRFDSSAPNPRYRGWVEGLRAHLQSVPVFCERAVANSHKQLRRSVA